MTDIVTSSLHEQIDVFHIQAAQQYTQPVVDHLNANRAAIAEEIRQVGIEKNTLHVSETAPEFTLPDAYDVPVTLSELLKHGPVVLTFYRGEWCPYCNLTLRAYQAILPQIVALHATLVAISPQTADKTLLTVDNKGLTYPVLSDLGNKVARAYRLVWTMPEARRATSDPLSNFNGDQSWELPMPGTFVIGQDGVVKAASVSANWGERMEPAALLEALREIG